jgi:hypothetical protein
MADDVVLTHTTFYAVLPGQDVVLGVTIGDGQAGGTALLLDGEPLPFENSAGSGIIGPGDELPGSILNIKTTVRDIRPDTNRTSVTYVLTGGVEDVEYPYSVEVSADAGTAHYMVTFVFTS